MFRELVEEQTRTALDQEDHLKPLWLSLSTAINAAFEDLPAVFNPLGSLAEELQPL